MTAYYHTKLHTILPPSIVSHIRKLLPQTFPPTPKHNWSNSLRWSLTTHYYPRWSIWVCCYWCDQMMGRLTLWAWGRPSCCRWGGWRRRTRTQHADSPRYAGHAWFWCPQSPPLRQVGHCIWNDWGEIVARNKLMCVCCLKLNAAQRPQVFILKCSLKRHKSSITKLNKTQMLHILKCDGRMKVDNWSTYLFIKNVILVYFIYTKKCQQCIRLLW